MPPKVGARGGGAAKPRAGRRAATTAAATPSEPTPLEPSNESPTAIEATDVKPIVQSIDGQDVATLVESSSHAQAAGTISISYVLNTAQ